MAGEVGAAYWYGRKKKEETIWFGLLNNNILCMKGKEKR